MGGASSRHQGCQPTRRGVLLSLGAGWAACQLGGEEAFAIDRGVRQSLAPAASSPSGARRFSTSRNAGDSGAPRPRPLPRVAYGAAALAVALGLSARSSKRRGLSARGARERGDSDGGSQSLAEEGRRFSEAVGFRADDEQSTRYGPGLDDDTEGYDGGDYGDYYDDEDDDYDDYDDDGDIYDGDEEKGLAPIQKNKGLVKEVTLGDGEVPVEVDAISDTLDPEDIVFGKHVPFSKLGITDESLLAALPSLGFMGSTRCQAAAIPNILAEDRRAVVIECETGSGKTLAFLLPAFQLVLERPPRDRESKCPVALIVVPGLELCFQVEAVAKQIASAIRGRKVSVHWARREWPQEVPDILICTPRAAAQGLEQVASEDEIVRRETLKRITDLELLAIDECDLPLAGDHHTTEDVQSVLLALSASYPARGRQVQPEAQVYYRNGIPVEVLDEETLEWKPARAYPTKQGTFHVRWPRTGTKFEQNSEWERFVRRSRIRGPGIGLMVENGPHVVLTCATLPSFHLDKQLNNPKRDWRFFNNGVGSPAWVIKRWFPNAIRVRSEWRHRRHPSIVNSEWIYIRGEKEARDGNVAARIDKVKEILLAQDPDVRTLVFCRRPEACLSAEVSFRRDGIACATVNAWQDFDDRIKSLKQFAIGEINVLICTDTIARGLDLPFCRHVINLEFPRDEVSYLHRVGRAARAGRPSKVTTLWGYHDDALREQILEAPRMGLDGQIISRRGQIGKFRAIRRKQKRQVAMHGVVRELAMNARKYTQNSDGKLVKSPGRMVSAPRSERPAPE